MGPKTAKSASVSPHRESKTGFSMGPKSTKRLAVAAVVLVLVIVSVFLIQRRQMDRLGASNFTEAEQAVESGDLATAERWLAPILNYGPGA